MIISMHVLLLVLHRYHFNQFAAGLEILKIYGPGIRCEKRCQTLFFDPSVTRDPQ